MAKSVLQGHRGKEAKSASGGAESLRRRRGVYYTPPRLASFIVRSALQSSPAGRLETCPTILDPACGDGAFLWAAWEQLLPLAGPAPAAQLNLLRTKLFGIDIDAAAIDRLRQRFAAPLADLRADQVAAVLEINFRCANALTDDSFPLQPSATNHQPPAFDIVVGNPPYRRERQSREEFAAIAGTAWGRRWREARMDLWHYFVHRGLDLLRPGGVLAFVVNAYWTASRGASKLVTRLAAETTCEELVLLGSLPVFPGVAGQHMIFRLRKGRAERPCRVVDCRKATLAEWEAFTTDRCAEDVSGVSRMDGKVVDEVNGCVGKLRPPGEMPTWSISQAELFAGGRIQVERPVTRQARSHRNTLGETFRVRQGIAENPPRITPRLNARFGGRFENGAGVFALSPAEVGELNWQPHEQALLRPYYSTRAIGRYLLSAEPTHWLIYSTRETIPDLADFPHLARHLDRFREILTTRREVANGRIAWWHLHWPREERLFREPRILAVQMGRAPAFVYVEQPAFVNFSVNVIASGPPSPALPHEGEGSELSLPVLAALLNSRRAAEWFERHAKQRGVHLDINGHVLRQFPLPGRHPEIESQMSVLSQRQHAGDNSAEKDIDDLVERWYGVE